MSSPRWFRAPKAYSCSSANTRVSCGGGSMKSKWTRSLMPENVRKNSAVTKHWCNQFKRTDVKRFHWEMSLNVYKKFFRLVPKLFSSRTTFPRLVLWISGTVVSSISCLKAQAVYSRKHFPAATLPARPARWLAEAWEWTRKTTLVNLLLSFSWSTEQITQQIKRWKHVKNQRLTYNGHVCRNAPSTGWY